MAKEHDIDPATFNWLFIFGALRNTVRNFKLGKMEKGESGMPLFWDKEIEKEYSVAIALGKLLYASKNRPTVSESIDIYQIISDDTGKLLKDETIPLKNVVIKFRLLQSELLSRMIENPTQKVSFDAEQSILIIGNRKVSFRKHTDQYHTLKTLFQDKDELNREWFFSEIGEKMDEYKKYKDKDFHNYLSAIKKRVVSETGIKDLFITTNHSVRVNSFYIK
ncbi:MAG: hypothetical protein AAB917_00800 [Patescibacteria group bacterium]